MITKSTHIDNVLHNLRVAADQIKKGNIEVFDAAIRVAIINAHELDSGIEVIKVNMEVIFKEAVP